MLSLFLSNFINKIDSKGRVSLPSSFRDVALKGGGSYVFIYKSITKNCLEGSDASYVDQLNNMIAEMDPFSEERDAFTTSIFGEGMILEFDKDGRMILPKKYLESIDIKDEIFFVGKGLTFEIWCPNKFKDFSEKCRDLSLKNAKMLKWHKS